MTIKVRILKNQSGFSLIELMISVAIVGMLSTIATGNLKSMTEKAENSSRISILAASVTIIEGMKALDDRYPTTAGLWYSSNAADALAAYQGPIWIPGAGTGTLPHEKLEALANCVPMGAANGWHPAFLYSSDGVNFKVMSHCASTGYTARIDPARKGPPAWAMALYSTGGFAF